MYKFNCYTDTHSPAECIGNIIDAIHSMQHAIDSGRRLDGQKAVADRRFTIRRLQAGGIDEFSDYDVYEVAGIEFKVYGTGCKHVSIDLPQFDLSGYPWEGSVILRDYGLKRDIRALLLVINAICDRDGITAAEYVEDVLGWEREDDLMLEVA